MKKKKGYNKMLDAYVIIFERVIVNLGVFLYFSNVLKIYSSDILKKNKISLEPISI